MVIKKNETAPFVSIDKPCCRKHLIYELGMQMNLRSPTAPARPPPPLLATSVPFQLQTQAKQLRR